MNSLSPNTVIPRQDSDTDIAYRRLLQYATWQPDDRAFASAARKWGIEVSSAATMIKRYDFRERVRAWDAHLAAATTEAMTKAVDEETRDLVRKHVQMWADVRNVGRKALDRILLNNGEDLSPTQALAFLDAAFKAERLLQGAATEHVAVVAKGLDTSALSMDELRTLRALLAKAGAGG